MGLASLVYKQSRLDREDGAGEGDQTLVLSLENSCSTIELHPHCDRHNRIVAVGKLLIAAFLKTRGQRAT